MGYSFKNKVNLVREFRPSGLGSAQPDCTEKVKISEHNFIKLFFILESQLFVSSLALTKVSFFGETLNLLCDQFPKFRNLSNYILSIGVRVSSFKNRPEAPLRQNKLDNLATLCWGFTYRPLTVKLRTNRTKKYLMLSTLLVHICRVNKRCSTF